MNSEPIIRRVLALVYADDYKPCKPRIIHQKLKLADDEYKLVRKAVKQLVLEGKVVFGANHLVFRPNSPTASTKPAKVKPAPLEDDIDSDRNLELASGLSTDIDSDSDSISPSKANRTKRPEIVGTFRMAPAGGFGFVRVPPAADVPPSDDIFIPPPSTRGAMDGDTVSVKIIQRGKDGKIEGAVEKIIARSRRLFVGTFQTIDNKAYVWLDGAKLDHPVSVGDIRGLPLNDNDKVTVEMVRFPDAFHPGEAVILKVLGSSKNPAVDTLAIMYQFNLPEEFPEAVLEDARKQADAFDEDIIPPGRTDLTKVPTLTIDPVDARDFDDAISLSKNEKGNWELQVHIADVSHFVPVGSALDDEAQKRGTSVYLPDRVIPMIPETISNHLASLQPDRKRLSKTVFMEYTPDGTLVYQHVLNSVICNQHRFNYEQIDQYLENRELWREKLKPEIFQLVGDMHELAMLLRTLRNQRGAIELTLPEVKIDLDRNGKVRGAHLVQHTESHQIIEEFMLAANQAVASWLDSLELPFLRRAHAPPNRIKMRRLNEFVRALGIEAENMEDRYEIQRVVQSVKGKPTEYAVNYAILKSMSKAVYQCSFERHYALDMSHYCHFTSPIRRYPDLVVHRIVQKLLDKVPAKENDQVLEQLGQQCSDAEQNAEFAERELTRVKLLYFLSKKQGELLSGVVAGVRPNGLTVRATEVPVDGFIPVQGLPNDRYRFDRETHTLEGFRSGNRFRLGDELIVRIDKVDIARRSLTFLLEKVSHHADIPSLPSKRRDRSERGRSDRSRPDKGGKAFESRSSDEGSSRGARPGKPKSKRPLGKNKRKKRK